MRGFFYFLFCYPRICGIWLKLLSYIIHKIPDQVGDDRGEAGITEKVIGEDGIKMG